MQKQHTLIFIIYDKETRRKRGTGEEGEREGGESSLGRSRQSTKSNQQTLFVSAFVTNPHGKGGSTERQEDLAKPSMLFNRHVALFMIQFQRKNGMTVLERGS